MNDFLQANYEQRRAAFVNDIEYMVEKNDQFANQRGGEETLQDVDKRIFEARKAQIIRLISYHDRAQEFIEHLQEWIDELIKENRRLNSEVSDSNKAWKAFFPRMTTQGESARDHERWMKLTQAQMIWPELY